MSKSSYECPGTTVVCVSRMPIYTFRPMMVKPLINGITLAIVLMEQKINEKKVEFRKTITFLRTHFSSRGEKIKGQMDP